MTVRLGILVQLEAAPGKGEELTMPARQGIMRRRGRC
jgi:hypothetical protein